MKMKRLMAAMMAGTMAFSLTACGGGSSAPADTGADAGASADAAADAGSEAKGYNIYVILKTTSSEYWGYVVAGANAYMADHPEVKVEVKGATSETAYDEQQNLIETDMNNGSIDGYVIAPLQADMVKTMIAGQTKPIVAVDTNIEAPEVVSFVGTGNEAAGEKGGKAAVEAAKAAGWTEIKAIEICGVQGDATNEARKAGYMKGVNGAGGEFLEGETQYADAVADKAVNCMEAIMQNHPEGIAIICANNDDMAMAAARAAKGNKAYEKTIFLGFDGIQSACNAILTGELTMSVAQQAYEMGYKSVETVVAALNGESVEAFVDAGCAVVDSSNAQERLDTLKGYLA